MEERRANLFIRRLHDGETDGMVHTRPRHVVTAVERHRVAKDDAAVAQRVGERIVRGHAAALEAIRFGEHDVQRDDGGAEIAQAGDQLPDHVAPPRPLADGGETAFVHVDDDDAIAERTRRHRAHQPVVDVELEAEQQRRAIERQHRDRRAWGAGRTAGSAGGNVSAGSSHGDFDASIPRLKDAVGGRHEKLGFAVRADVDGRQRQAGIDEEIAHRVRAPQSELGVRLLGARGVGVSDHHDIGNRRCS